MKKVAILASLLILLGAGAWLAKNKFTQVSKVPAQKTSTPTINYKKACDVFSLRDAVAVFGDGTTQTPTHSDSVSPQRSVTTCLYSYDPGSFSDLVSASVLLQADAMNQTKQSFLHARPTDAITVAGYGDQAYWDGSLGQLHILKGNYWVIISAGMGPLNQRDQDLPRMVADSIMKQL